MKNKILIYLLSFVCLSVFFLPYSTANTNETLYLNHISDCYVNVGYHINIKDDYAFVADNDGITVIDISDPNDISWLTTIDLPSSAFGLQIVDNTAYVAGSNEGFYIIDISDIYNPLILGHHSHNGTAHKVFVLENLAFVADYYSGLRIYDITNSSNPILECLYYETGNIWDVAVRSNIAYVANPYGLEVLNVSNPSAPVQLSVLPFSYDSTHLSIHGDKLFVGRHGQGINVYDISTPSSPSFISSYWDDDEGEELGLRSNDTILCVADNYGIELFDISGLPTISKLAEYRDGVGAAHDLELDGNYIYAVDGLTGIFVLEISNELNTETSFMLLTSVVFTLPIILLKKRN